MTKKGFTLLELIIVVAVISLLAAATFVAVDPAKRIGNARNAQRWADITSIADAFMNYTADNSGTYVTTTVNGTTYQIQNVRSGASSAGTCTASTTATTFVSLFGLVDSGYVGTINNDPSGADNNSTDYYFMKDANGTVTVGACTTYDNNSATIKVIR